MDNPRDRYQQLVQRASSLLAAVRGLDQAGLRNREPAAVGALHIALRRLGLSSGAPAGGEGEARRREQLFFALREAGFGDRIGSCNDSRASGRMRSWQNVPHRRGLPRCDWVVAPDFNPVDGLHVILVTPGEVLSCVLPAAESTKPWQVRETLRFDQPEEMVRRVDAVATGMAAA